MKNIKIKLLGLGLLLTMSCNTDDHTGDSTRTTSDAKATLNLNFSQSTVYNEENQDVLTYTISLDKPQIADVVAYVSLVSGTATEGEDFNYDHSITIPAYQLSATGSISILYDETYEPTETFTLKIGDERFANANFDPQEITVQIGNSDNLRIELSWDGTFNGNNGSTDFCDIDMDLELLDSGGNYVETSYSSCPEEIIISSLMPDDTYTLVVSLWTNDGETAAINIPANVEFSKIGGQTPTESLDVSNYFLLSDGGLDDGNSNAYIEYTIVKTGQTYTITDQNSAQVFQGRYNNISQAIRTKILNKNKK
ncbi:conserved exported hypothetical protein [Flavobacterium sp. 9AF]|uniref:Calx-beta domain-containing protein n=1 Tax=Flavobacterium sp. 9AF TaxID=2653142 RepID=UPI0012F18E96|nr:Calx-beta domain-containing protein [Flavobacterium sp. 9AF]VXB47090.1 conserved exported hypothetical protein [Flavobacterium sp. 9AF]